MSVTYKTPGVYVQEAFNKSVSIPSVSTSIPAFLGKTVTGGSATPSPKRITSILEFKEIFGVPASPEWNVISGPAGLAVEGGADAALPAGEYLLYYALNHFFLNGGGPCYVVALADDTVAQYQNGLDALAKYDEPTLILPCGAVQLEAAEYHSICKSALAQCINLRDRFCIIDVQQASLDARDSVRVVEDMEAFRSGIGGDNLAYGAAYYPNLQTALGWEIDPATVSLDGRNFELLTKTEQGNLQAFLRGLKVTLPPSAAVAGAFTTVDKNRGVWKAPANVSLNYVIRPEIDIERREQDDMNMPSGKAPVNAIRNFPNLGPTIWGARTLDYQAADWTFVSVRRLFIMVEESIAKAVNTFVFEANDKSTWTYVKSAISNYLYRLWSDGALAGSKPEDAYQVQVGLGETMTAEDVREGRMVVEVGIAPVRPAEFVVLVFSQNVKGA